MATYQVAIYSSSDLTIVSLGGGNFSVTLNVGATPTIVTVTDTDTGANETIFNDGNPAVDGGVGWATPNQTFSGNIDGTNYVNSTINPEESYSFDGGIGDIFTLRTDDGGDFIGYGFTFNPVEGVTYTLNTSNDDTTPDIEFEDIYVCFTKGTEIETIDGKCLIEDLKLGDLIWTENHGFQPLQWIGSRHVRATGSSVPVRIKSGTFGATDDLLISQQHRILVSGYMAELMFGEPKMLAAAKSLVNGDTVFLDHSVETVEYFHILFKSHEIVLANGTLSESFYPGPVALNTLENAQRDEVLMLFPELSNLGSEQCMAYPELRAFEARALTF